MVYALLFVGASALTPASLGTFSSYDACQNSIRAIYEQKMTPRGIEITPQLAESIKFAVENKMKYQKEYFCQLRDKK